MRTLDAGPIDEMVAEYGDSGETADFQYDAALKPSVIVKSKPEISLEYN